MAVAFGERAGDSQPASDAVQTPGPLCGACAVRTDVLHYPCVRERRDGLKFSFGKTRRPACVRRSGVLLGSVAHVFEKQKTRLHVEPGLLLRTLRSTVAV